MHRIGRSLVAVALGMFWIVPAAFAQGGASLSIVSPTAGHKVTDTNIAVQVKVANFTVDCLQAGMPDKAGVGHIHAMLDGMSMASLTNFYCSNSFTISGQGVKSGQHTMIIDLASNTHMDMEDTAQKVTFDYEPTTPAASLPSPANTGTPTIAISDLTDGQTVGPKFSFTAPTTNFHPSFDLEGKQNVAGYGHIHVFVDMPMMGTSSSSNRMMSMAGMVGMPGSNNISLDLSGWPGGKHTITLQLVQNDHTPIMDAKEAMVTINLNNPSVPATAAMPSALPQTGGNPYALPGALLVSAILVGGGVVMRRLRPH
jgi:hypothetical protein